MAGTLGLKPGWKIVHELNFSFVWTLDNFRMTDRIPASPGVLTTVSYTTVGSYKWALKLTNLRGDLLVKLCLDHVPRAVGILTKLFGPTATELESEWFKLGSYSEILDASKGCKTTAVGNGNLNETQLAKDYSEFFNKETLSDVEILNADDAVLHAHKVILAGHSPVFAAMFENKRKRVEAKKISSEALYEMLSFMYSGKLKNQEDVKFMQDLLGTADLYKIIPLKTLCEQILIKSCGTESVLDLFTLGDKCGCQGLKEAALRVIEINKDVLLESSEWSEFAEQHPKLAYEATYRLLKVKRKKLF